MREKGGRNYKIVRQGESLYLKPWLGSGVEGDGLYMKTGKGLYMKTGKGILLGPNFPFQNIPLLGLTVKNYIIKRCACLISLRQYIQKNDVPYKMLLFLRM